MGCYSRWRLNRVAAGSQEPSGFREHLAACERCRIGLDMAIAARWAKSRLVPRPLSPTDHLTPEAMLQLTERKLSGRRRQRAITHLAGCEPCRAQFAGFLKAAQALDAGATVQPIADGLRHARALWRQATSRPADSDAIPRASVKNPVTICLLADDSQSMAGEPAAEATEAIRDFVSLLQSSCAGRGSYFHLLLVKFGDFPTVLANALPILDVDPRQIELAGTSGGTDIAGALELARSRLSTSAASAGALPPLLLLYSDGRPTGPDPGLVSRQIKALSYPADQHPLLVTCGFGEADEALLQGLATSPEHYKRLNRPAELRQFLSLVGSSVSTVAAEGRSASALRRGIGRALAQAA